MLGRYVIAVATVTASGMVPAHAEPPAALCKRVGTDDTSRAIPESLVPAVSVAFGMRMPTRMVMDTTVFRCVGGHVMVCTVGANLPCGKANTSREPGVALVQWCRENPDAEVVPAVATGHDTVYQWRCQAGMAQIVQQTLHVDQRGFVAEFWKTLR